jgi:pyruvate,water dikinase
MGFLERMKRLLSREPAEAEDRSPSFQAKYISFKEILSANTEILNIITDLEETLLGRKVFGMSYIRSQAARAVFYAMRMIQGLNFISGQKYFQLLLSLGEIEKKIKAIVERPKEPTADRYVISYNHIDKEMLDWVGGKSANLGELRSRLNVPTPPGFAITTRSFERFMQVNGLEEEVGRFLRQIDTDDLESISTASREIRERILAAPLPEDLATAIAEASLKYLPDEASHSGPLAMRSSAVGEDGEFSFAGQYLSVLNVSREELGDVYRRIVASLYNENALLYRLSKGIREEEMAMGVACLQVIPSVASGVIYSRDPLDSAKMEILINAVWGLGAYAVDGTITPDRFRVRRDNPGLLVEERVAPKAVQLVLKPGGGVEEKAVPDNLVHQPALRRDQIFRLAEFALRIEAHYGCPQDIEWALHPDGRLLVLQARPLGLIAGAQAGSSPRPAQLNGHPLLAQGGETIFPGAAAGPAFFIRKDEDLARLPAGAVMVAKKSSPRYVVAMRKALAIVTEIGSVTGHMASLAREFRIPTVFNLPGATDAIGDGALITVDASAGAVYTGRVEELLTDQTACAAPPPDTPAYRALRRVADLIVPLHLHDPKASDFRPESCRSLHDITRMVHELCYKEMFQISDMVSYREGAAVKLDVQLPIDLYVVDLGGGLRNYDRRKKKVGRQHVACAPFDALLTGLLHADLACMGPRPVSMSGFFSVMREQMLAPPSHVERFGERSYAIISDRYLNFSSRVGYHYSILDCYSGPLINENYITFCFKGGAADDIRRNRRVRSIARILETLDFLVEVRGDRVDARLLKYDSEVLAAKLDQIGRLLLFTRQMDMLMNSETSVDAAAQSFLSGDYHLECTMEKLARS